MNWNFFNMLTYRKIKILSGRAIVVKPLSNDKVIAYKEAIWNFDEIESLQQFLLNILPITNQGMSSYLYFVKALNKLFGLYQRMEKYVGMYSYEHFLYKNDGMIETPLMVTFHLEFSNYISDANHSIGVFFKKMGAILNLDLKIPPQHPNLILITLTVPSLQSSKILKRLSFRHISLLLKKQKESHQKLLNSIKHSVCKVKLMEDIRHYGYCSKLLMEALEEVKIATSLRFIEIKETAKWLAVQQEAYQARHDKVLKKIGLKG